MKKFNIIVVVMSILMTLTQCKKKDLQVYPTTDDNATYISLNVNNGTKVGVADDGVVSFEKDDVIYVVSNGIYIGSLRYNGEHFYGPITGAEIDKPLYFYFFGNQSVGKIEEGVTTSCAVSIGNQNDRLPIISYGMSDQVYLGAGSYSAFLRNQCALVKFSIDTDSETEPICINGLNNYVYVDFSKNDFTFSQIDGGIIQLGVGSGERWAILLPTESTIEEGDNGTAYSADFRYVGRRPAIAAVEANDLVSTPYTVSVKSLNVADGTFSLNGEKRVVFAKGNLQYIGSAKVPYWTFAEHQYDVLANTSIQNGGGSGIDRDRFGWGTGDNPDEVSTTNLDYKDYSDWGKHFAPVDGKPWHAPKCVEWEYVMFTRTASKLNDVYNARYARACIIKPNGDRINGIILFPDVYYHPDGVNLPVKNSINFTNDNNSSSYADNEYSVAAWNLMEDAGAVFLPAAGQRIVKNGSLGFYNVNEEGHYWSQCDLGDSEHACNMYYTNYRPYIYDKNDKYKGFSVRLVHE